MKITGPLLTFLAAAILTNSAVFAQNRIGTGSVDQLYQQHCASCHGPNLEGGSGSSFLDDEWKHGATDADLARSISNGFPELGMVPWKGILTDEQIRSLVIYIREKRQLVDRDALLKKLEPREGVFSSEKHSFRLEKVAELDGILWSINFLPDHTPIVTQRDGKLWLIKNGKLDGPKKGTPNVWLRGQGGLLEVAPHPEYEANGWIYLTYSESVGGKDDGKEAGMTAVVRGRIKNGTWVDQEEIYHAPKNLHSSAGVHFGSRIVFKDGYLFFGIGDRGRQPHVQDLSRPNGKIHRLHDDGRIPGDNPFAKVPGALPTIWSFGHRNPQGLDMNPETGEIWESEHGPRGGDEINRIHAGRNYGWPVITYGMNYNGSPMTDRVSWPGMEQPKNYYVPSIAICGIDFYEGNAFPKWKNNLFVCGMASQELHRLVIENGKVVDQEIVMKNQGRIRDVASGPDGSIYLSLVTGNKKKAGLYKMVSVE